MAKEKMMDLIERSKAIDAVHGAIIEFFDICDDGEELPLTHKDKQLLEINKAISSRIKQLPSAQPETAKQTEETVQYVSNDELISRKAAIDAIRTKYCSSDFMDDGVIDAFAEIIQDVPSAQPEQRWIPCSERLPEKNGRYLVTRGLKACNSIWNRVYIVNYSDLMGLKTEKIWWDGNVGKSDFQKIDDVIAWREKPEPWRGEEK